MHCFGEKKKSPETGRKKKGGRGKRFLISKNQWGFLKRRGMRAGGWVLHQRGIGTKRKVAIETTRKTGGGSRGSTKGLAAYEKKKKKKKKKPAGRGI